MKKSRQRLIQDGGKPLILVSGAVELVRALTWRAWAGYLAGTVPFLLACCYFVSDMARSVDAGLRLGGWCLLLLICFVACKLSQVDLAGQMIARLSLSKAKPWSFQRVLDVGCLQLAVQSTGLVLYPIGLLLTLPAGWVNAFYQSFYFTGGGLDSKEARPVGTAWRHAVRWPIQNHWALAAFTLLVAVVLLNFVTLSVAIPWLGKTLLGWETTISRNYMTAFNSTLLMLELGLAWLITDPLHKAIYALRCFRGDSIENGDDLRAAAMVFRRSGSVGAGAWVLAAGMMVWMGGMRVNAAESEPVPSSAARVAGGAASGGHEELSRAMEQVLLREEYRWRLSGEEALTRKSGADLTIWEWLWKQVDGALNAVGDLVKTAMRQLESWLKKWFSGRNTTTAGNHLDFDWAAPIKVIAILLLLALAAFLTWWLVKNLDRSKVQSGGQVGGGDAPPDLRLESVTAADLPVSGWRELGARLLLEREFRLAMRAFHLAALATLADQRLITLARFKSNRDYLRELERRGHAIPLLVAEFRGGLEEFEGVWYGDHPASEEAAVRYRERMQLISASRAEGGAM